MKKPKIDSNIGIRIDSDTYESYKTMCEKSGFDVSKRLRKFIEYELLYDSNNLNIIKHLDNLI